MCTLCSISWDQRLCPALEAAGCTSDPGTPCQHSGFLMDFFFKFHLFIDLFFLSFRLQGMLRHFVPGSWKRALWMPWPQRIWTRCRLEQMFSFASSMPRRTSKNCVICIVLRIDLSLIMYFSWFLCAVYFQIVLAQCEKFLFLSSH